MPSKDLQAVPVSSAAPVSTRYVNRLVILQTGVCLLQPFQESVFSWALGLWRRRRSKKEQVCLWL